MKLIFPLIAFYLFCQDSTDRIKVWGKQTELEYKDFRGTIDEDSPYSAISYVGFNYEYSNNVVNAFCYFDCGKSWIKGTDSFLLVHEQGHFNLSEVYVRRLKRMIESHDFKRNSIEFELDSLYNANFAEFMKTNELYEHETNYSNNHTMQHQWNITISKWLSDLEEYSSHRIFINFDD
jgi:hypothetical protein